MRSDAALVLLLSCIPLVHACRSTAAPAPATGTLEVNGTRLYFERHGETGPDLVFLQGSQLPCGMWREQAAEFARDHRVLLYDVRGFGRSGPYGDPFSHPDDLRALLDRLGIERGTLIGLSLGGRIAIEFALEHPERVEALVLVGPGLVGFPWEAEPPAWVARLEEAFAGNDGAAAVEAWLMSGYMAPAMENPELAPRIRALAHENERLWLHDSTEVPLDPPALGRLHEIRCPALLLIGSRDVPVIHAIAGKLGSEVPGIRKVVMEGVGHVPNLERPAEFDRIVRGFLHSLR